MTSRKGKTLVRLLVNGRCLPCNEESSIQQWESDQGAVKYELDAID